MIGPVSALFSCSTVSWSLFSFFPVSHLLYYPSILKKYIYINATAFIPTPRALSLLLSLPLTAPAFRIPVGAVVGEGSASCSQRRGLRPRARHVQPRAPGRTGLRLRSMRGGHSAPAAVRRPGSSALIRARNGCLLGWTVLFISILRILKFR